MSKWIPVAAALLLTVGCGEGGAGDDPWAAMEKQLLRMVRERPEAVRGMWTRAGTLRRHTMLDVLVRARALDVLSPSDAAPFIVARWVGRRRVPALLEAAPKPLLDALVAQDDFCRWLAAAATGGGRGAFDPTPLRRVPKRLRVQVFLEALPLFGSPPTLDVTSEAPPALCRWDSLLLGALENYYTSAPREEARPLWSPKTIAAACGLDRDEVVECLGALLTEADLRRPHRPEKGGSMDPRDAMRTKAAVALAVGGALDERRAEMLALFARVMDEVPQAPEGAGPVELPVRAMRFACVWAVRRLGVSDATVRALTDAAARAVVRDPFLAAYAFLSLLRLWEAEPARVERLGFSPMTVLRGWTEQGRMDAVVLGLSALEKGWPSEAVEKVFGPLLRNAYDAARKRPR